MCDKTIKEAAAKIVVDLLPQKSQKIYEKCYKEFCDWCLVKQVDEIHSESALLVYFAEKAKHFKASTLWSHYSMIKSSFRVKNNVDISKYSRLLAFLKRQNVGYQAKKSKIFTKEQIDRFLTKAPDEIYLMAKVAMIMGIAGALRSDKLVKLSIDDVQNLGSTILVQPVKKNIFRGLPRQIASYLKLPDSSSYTGYCFRPSSTSLLAYIGADISVLKRHGGWRSTTVAEGYVDNSLNNKKMIAQKILMGKDSEEENRPSTFSSLNQVDICMPIRINNTNQLKSLFTISGGSNINVNINIK